MELWDLYTPDRQPTGRTHIRGEKLPDGLCHLVVHVWIQNSTGEFLISQRSADRPRFPLMWETVGGSVLAGEDSLAAALRETREEVGIQLDPGQGQLLHSIVQRMINSKPSDDILDVWLFHYNGSPDLSCATCNEVAQTKWMTPAQIKALCESGKLVDTLHYFFTKVNPTEEQTI